MSYNVLLTHYPMSRSEIAALVPVYVHLLIHGHSHKKKEFIDRSVPAINVCAEWLEYRFWRLDDLVDLVL